MTPPDNILARHPSGDWFVLRGVGCIRTPVSRHPTFDEAMKAAGL